MDILHYTLLYDFYGELLTSKQKQIFELFHLDDLSLTEIGEELLVSRQAVHDQLKRTEKILEGYEEKLMLVKRFLKQKEEILRIGKLITEIENKLEFDDDIFKAIEEIKSIANGFAT